MKILKILGLLIVLVCFSTTVNAQFLKKLGKAAERAAERTLEKKVEEKSSKETEKAFDTVFNKNKGTKKRKNKKRNKDILSLPKDSENTELQTNPNTGKEELTTICAGTRICHRQPTGGIECQI